MIKYIQTNLAIIIMGFAVLISGGTLMLVSQKVYHAQKNVNNLSQDILATEWEIRALKAELAYLSRPDRLEQISLAMTQSISPDLGDRIAIAPVSYRLPDDITNPTLTLIPQKKPMGFRNITYQKPQTQNTQPPSPQPKKSSDFSSLLQSIGGGE
jgi:hypothetical protein